MIFFTNIIFCFSITIAFLYAVFFLFLMVGWIRTNFFSSSEKIIFGGTKISIVIPVRNEENNILKCLESLLLQDYPKELTELIIVDDFSEDETFLLLKNALQKNNFSNVILISSQKAGKKNAISSGIEKATGTLIITTDADCTFPQKWLSTIVLFYEKNHPKFIFSSVIFADKKTFFQKLQSVEFAGLVAVGGASAYFNFPLMCNGANLAFEKIIFQEVNGFEGNEHISSGDDLFLMEKIRKKYPSEIKFLKSAEATVFTKEAPNLKSFISQRKRWASKTVRLKSKFILWTGGIIWSMNFLVLFSACFIAYNKTFIALFLFLFATKCIIDFLFLFLAVSFFEKRSYVVCILIIVVFYPIYVLYMSVFGSFGKINWKNRVISK
ncbi:MAG: glycosyltransferase [Bacteroidia bacterium]